MQHVARTWLLLPGSDRDIDVRTTLFLNRYSSEPSSASNSGAGVWRIVEVKNDHRTGAQLMLLKGRATSGKLISPSLNTMFIWNFVLMLCFYFQKVRSRTTTSTSQIDRLVAGVRVIRIPVSESAHLISARTRPMLL